MAEEVNPPDDALVGAPPQPPPPDVDSAMPMTRQQYSSHATQCASLGDYDQAIAWCSRAIDFPTSSPSPEAVAALLLRRAEYEMKADRFEEAARDAHKAVSAFSDAAAAAAAESHKKKAKAVRLQCRALLALSHYEEALEQWQTHMSMGSAVLDKLAFQREFNVDSTSTSTTADAVQDDSNGKYDTALQYLYRRDFGNCIAHLSKLLDAGKKSKKKSKSKDPVLFLLRARCRMELHEYEGAVSDAERVVTLLPTALEAYRWLCEALIALKYNKQASKVCQAGLLVSPEDEKLTALLHRLEEAASNNKKKTKKDGKDKQNQEPSHVADDAIEGKGITDTEYDEGTVDAAEDPAFGAIRELKKAIRVDPTNASLHTRLARLRLELKQFEQAQNDAAQAISLDATRGDGYVVSCEALYGARRYAKALRVCEQALRLVEDNTVLLQEWQAKIQDALIDPPLEELLVQAQQPSPSRVPKAVAARRQQKAQRTVEEAQALHLKCYEKAVALADGRDFGNAVFWLNKAEGYYEAAGAAAGKDFHSHAAQLCGLRARCRYELKQYEPVIIDAQHAIQLDPSDVESYKWLVLALRARGYTQKARDACAAGLQVSSEHKGLLALQKSLGDSINSR